MEVIRTKTKIGYRDCVYINGRKKNSPVFHRKSDCIDWKRRMMADISRSKALGIPVEQVRSVTFGAFFQEWLQSKQIEGVSPITLLNYESKARAHLLPHFGATNLQDISINRVEKLIKALMVDHSPKGTNDILVLLKQVFRYAHRRQLIGKNPLEHLKNLPVPKQPDVFWTESQINQFLLAAKDHPLYEVFVVALNTGLRRGELAGLCWDRVDFIGGQLIISRTRGKSGLQQSTKTKIVRYVPINDVVRSMLQRCRERSPGSEFVFTVDGQPFDVHHLYRVFKQLQRKAGITSIIRFHDLRHTFASQFVMKGGRPYDLQRILGHSSFQMTERYAHLSHEHLRDAVGVVKFGEELSAGLSQIYPINSEVIDEGIERIS